MANSKLSGPFIKIHERDLRGRTNIGWLNSKHTFSFGGFMDPTRMGFRSLRVVNDDIVAPGGGFGTHPHDNMEIIPIALDGALEHRDSMGNGSVIHPGEIQKMSAGTGITHSEYNHSKSSPVHFYQIWIIPDKREITPGYEQITLDPAKFKNGFALVGDRHGGGSHISICQDARMYLSMPGEGATITYNFAEGRYGFLQVAHGQVLLQGKTLEEGDGIEISGMQTLNLLALTDAELILFDIA